MKNFKWFAFNPDHPRHPDRTKSGGLVRMLCYQALSTLPQTLLGYVARTGDGQFYPIFMHKDLIAGRWKLVLFPDMQGASDYLEQHTESELRRFMKNNTPHKYVASVTLNSKDIVAGKQYVSNTSDRSFRSGFIAGVDWALHSQGIPKKPSWANYVVQNRDGSITWFENKPEVDHGAGVWHADGKRRTVKIHEQWSCSLTKCS
jgi:hypothetical protein